MRVSGAILFSAVLLVCCTSAFAQDAQCTFSASNISFGTVDLQKGNPYDAAGTFSYACTGNSREIIRICPSWGVANDGTRWMTDSAGHKLLYNLYTDADRNTVWGTWYSKTTKGASIEVPLGRSERITGNVPVYGRIVANQQSVPAGAYQANINGGNAAVSYGYASKGDCESFKHGSRVSVGVKITASVHGAGSGPAPITAPDATNPNTGTGPQASSGQSDQKQKKSLMQKLKENAEYQQQQQDKAAGADSSSSQPAQEARARNIESNSCMTTMGADKANELADDCKQVTTGSHKGCNIQENTCDEIRSTTQKGCWGLAASAPDFCLTKYR